MFKRKRILFMVLTAIITMSLVFAFGTLSAFAVGNETQSVIVKPLTTVAVVKDPFADGILCMAENDPMLRMIKTSSMIDNAGMTLDVNITSVYAGSFYDGYLTGCASFSNVNDGKNLATNAILMVQAEPSCRFQRIISFAMTDTTIPYLDTGQTILVLTMADTPYFTGANLTLAMVETVPNLDTGQPMIAYTNLLETDAPDITLTAVNGTYTLDAADYNPLVVT